MFNQKPRMEQSFDLIVIGGGLAGLCAAVAAARKGVATALIHDRPVLGGNASSEIRVAPLGAASYNILARETGLLEEILLEERRRNHEAIWDGMANSHFDLALYEIVKREPNLRVFLNTTVRSVDVEPVAGGQPQGERRITAVYGSQLASEQEFCFQAAQFADCTGDATVGALAGAEFRYGREARAEFNEPLAPVQADQQTMGSTLTMCARNIGRPTPFLPPPWIHAYQSQEDIGPYRKLSRFNKVDYGGYWWIEIGTPYHQIDDNQTIKDELLKHVLGVWNFIKNHSPDRERAVNYALEWVGMVPGKRESRRLVGDVIVTEADCHQDRGWPDRVCYAGWPIDLHIMGGILNKLEPPEMSHGDKHYNYWTHVAPFSLPLRALYSRNIRNLWMAGRNISATHVALGTTRVMMTNALQGQAVGTAAAYALQSKLTPRQAADPGASHIKRIQQTLLRDDVNVLGLPNEDPDDLARSAQISATSSASLDFGDPDPSQWIALDQPYAQVLPVTSANINRIGLFLKNSNSGSVECTGRIEQLDRIWDQNPGRRVAEFKLKAPAGCQEWVDVEINCRLAPGFPYRIALPKVPGLSWARSSRCPIGGISQFLHEAPGGGEPQHAGWPHLQKPEVDLPAYQSWIIDRGRQNFAVHLDPAQKPYEASNVNNGWAWPFAMPNLWISAPGVPLPQAVTFTFETACRFNTVLVSFDTDLSRTYHAMPGLWRAPACARDWKLWAKAGNTWTMIFSASGNYQRRRTARFAAVTATALKLEILATNAAPDDGEHQTARVYEVRIYER